MMQMREHDGLGFSQAEYRRRYEVVLSGMRALGLDGMIVRSPENICYVTGYESLGYYKFHALCLLYREVGVGTSATVRVTETGCEALTTFPRRLLIR